MSSPRPKTPLKELESSLDGPPFELPTIVPLASRKKVNTYTFFRLSNLLVNTSALAMNVYKESNSVKEAWKAGTEMTTWSLVINTVDQLTRLWDVPSLIKNKVLSEETFNKIKEKTPALKDLAFTLSGIVTLYHWILEHPDNNDIPVELLIHLAPFVSYLADYLVNQLSYGVDKFKDPRWLIPGATVLLYDTFNFTYTYFGGTSVDNEPFINPDKDWEQDLTRSLVVCAVEVTAAFGSPLIRLSMKSLTGKHKNEEVLDNCSEYQRLDTTSDRDPMLYVVAPPPTSPSDETNPFVEEKQGSPRPKVLLASPPPVGDWDLNSASFDNTPVKRKSFCEKLMFCFKFNTSNPRGSTGRSLHTVVSPHGGKEAAASFDSPPASTGPTYTFTKSGK